MKIKEIAILLNAKVYGNTKMLENDVEFAFSSDLMSDVLTIKAQNILLLTGLANIQSLRTAEMSDIVNIIYVRGKKVSDEMITLAKETGILLLECEYSMFKTSGILYKAGIKPIY
jgi:predicted transcriptional regulator